MKTDKMKTAKMKTAKMKTVKMKANMLYYAAPDRGAKRKPSSILPGTFWPPFGLPFRADLQAFGVPFRPHLQAHLRLATFRGAAVPRRQASSISNKNGLQTIQ